MIDTSLNELIRNKPSLSLVVPKCYTKVLRETTGKPMIIRQAKAFAYTLENLPIIIRVDEQIVGTFDEKIPVAIPRFEASGFRILRELETLSNRPLNPIDVDKNEIELLKSEISPFYENFKIDTYAREIAPKINFDTSLSGCAYVATEIGGIAHVVVDYERLLKYGLNYYINKSKENIEKLKNDLVKNSDAGDKIAFYKAIIIISEALIGFAKRYSEKAKSLANQENYSTRKEQLHRIVRACENVPANPPRNLQEAIQLIWFIHMALHIENFEHGISFGRIDQYLYPYYNENSTQTFALILNLLLKTNEIIALYDTVATQYFGGMATTQNMLISGIDKNGNDASNPLTYIILDAIDQASVPSPNLVVRVHRKTPQKVYKQIAKILSKGKNVIGLYNDELVVNSLTNFNVPLEEARNYGIVGCVGISTSGTSYDNTGAVFMNLPKALELALGTDKSLVSKTIKNYELAKNYESMDQLLKVFCDKLKALMKMAATTANSYQEAHKKLKPTPLMSLCIRQCFENGFDVNEGSAKYNFSGIHVTGFSDVIDSLSAIDWAVFKEKEITMEALINAIRNNFRGYKDILNYLRYKCPKYGNDDDNADIFAIHTVETLHDSVRDLFSARGGAYRVGIHAMTTHVGFGLFTGALPSGRKKGTPLTRDIAPGHKGEKGLTAAIKSISKFDHSLLANGVACTFNINPNIILIDDGKIFESLIRTYIKLNGSHLQFNSISLDMLEDAQREPEKYKNLMVRVSGYSARFIDLPKAVQDDIMTRYTYCMI